MLLSIIGQMLVQVVSQILGYVILTLQSWHEPFPGNKKLNEVEPCAENTVI
jgi:hypothetical protein